MGDEINSIIDIAAIEKEKVFLINTLQEILTIVDKIKGTTVDIKGAASIKDISKANIQLAESHKAVDSLVRQRFASEAKLAVAQTDYAVATAKARNETSKYSAEIKAEVQAEQASIGSRERATAQIKVLTLAKNKLNLINAEEKSQYDQLVAKIEKYDRFLKQSGTTAEKQRANVGNYTGAINILKVSLDEVAKKIDAYNRSGKTNVEILKLLEKEQTILTQLVNSQAAGFANAAMEIKANEKALLQMTAAGLQGSEAFDKLALATGQLKDDMGDLKARTKALGSDTFALDGLIQGAQALSGAYQVAQGAAALFGEENEDLQKTFVKLQAAMSVTQGLQAIQQTLQKESALMLGIQTVRTKALTVVETVRQFILKGTLTATAAQTAATGANTVAQGVNAAATRGATVAMIGLRAALIASGIGLILVLLASAASAMGVFGKETSKAEQSLEDFNKELEYSNQLLDSSIKGIQQRGELDVLGLKKRGATESEVHAQELKNIKDVGTAYNDQYLKRKSEYDDLMKKADGYFQAANKASGSFKTIGDVQGLTDKGAATLEKAKSLITEIDALREKSRDSNNEAEVKAAEYDVKLAEDRRKAAQTNQKKLDDDRKKRAEQYAKDELAAQIELSRLLFEQRKKEADDIVSNEKAAFDARLKGIAAYQAAARALIAFEEATASKDATPAQKEVAKQKAKMQTYELEVDISNKINNLYDKDHEKRKKQQEEDLATFKKVKEQQKQLVEDNIDSTAGNEALAVQAEYEIKLQGTTGERRAALEKELEAKLLEITRDAELAKSELRLAGLQTQLRVAKLFGFNTSTIEKAITEEMQFQANIRKGISDDEYEHKKTNEEKLLEVRKAIGSAAKNFLGEFAQGLFDTEKNKTQDRMDLVDKEKAKKIEAVNAELISNEEKAAKINIIEKLAQNEKEKLERKQRQTDLDRARFERVAALVEITAHTGKAVVKAIAASPLTFGQPWVTYALALGALQAAAILARPLPRFKEGKNNSYEGLAVVDDGGEAEPIWRKNGAIEMGSNKPRVTWLGRDDKVFPSFRALMKQMRPAVKETSTINFQPVVDAIGNISISTQIVTERGHEWRNQKINEYNDWVKRNI